MDLSIFLFRLFGFYLVIVGFAYIFKREYFREAVRDLFQSPGLLLITAIINLLLGLALVLNYNYWELSARGVVTLLGYLILFKGVTRLFFPYWGKNSFTRFFDGVNYLVMGVLTILLGIWLLYLGYDFGLTAGS